eukprot:989014-Amphidinium_carterae.1
MPTVASCSQLRRTSLGVSSSELSLAEAEIGRSTPSKDEWILCISASGDRIYIKRKIFEECDPELPWLPRIRDRDDVSFSHPQSGRVVLSSKFKLQNLNFRRASLLLCLVKDSEGLGSCRLTVEQICAAHVSVQEYGDETSRLKQQAHAIPRRLLQDLRSGHPQVLVGLLLSSGHK